MAGAGTLIAKGSAESRSAMRSPSFQRHFRLPLECSASISRSSDVRNRDPNFPSRSENFAMDVKTPNMTGTAMRPVGLIIRQKDPNNLEMPFDQLDDFITPTELFYIRSHFPAPDLDVGSYCLSIRASLRPELSLTYAEIRAMPSRSRIATLECAGNGRVFLVPPAPGAQWELAPLRTTPS